jgi:hypothetical protein
VKFKDVNCNSLDKMGLGAIKYHVHPLHVLAVHLAFVTKPGASWIALSYSPGRFQFLEPGLGENLDEALPPGLLKQGFPDTSALWKLEGMAEVEGGEELADQGRLVHRPKIVHYLFTLRRTDVGLSWN